MADLQQKLDSVQQKSKLDEKARNKEVEKLKVQLQQVSGCGLLCVHICMHIAYVVLLNIW